jgi:hypothetical protein
MFLQLTEKPSALIQLSLSCLLLHSSSDGFRCNILQIKEAIFQTLIRNGMFDNAHIRLSLTRGKKVLFSETLCFSYVNSLFAHNFYFILINVTL